jgi:hypothetical protein
MKTDQASDASSFQPYYQFPFHGPSLPVLSENVIQALGTLADSREEDTFMRIADSIVGTNSNGNAALTLYNPQVQTKCQKNVYPQCYLNQLVFFYLSFSEPAATNEANILEFVSKQSINMAATV